MNQAIMTIDIRVMARQALSAMRQVQVQTAAVGTAATRSSAAIGGLNNILVGGNLAKFGKNLQWTGRQLEFSFTLPLVLAGAAATKWALDNETAMTRVRKVYGDGTESAAQLNEELGQLSESFRLLSDRFGVHQAEVIEIAGSWAQAGSAGVALARSTRLTLESMILGEMDAARAVEGLIAVQSTYRLNTEQLTLELARMNSIENATSISFQGLIDVVTRAGGAARTAGIDIRHLSAMAASLVPAAGSAAQAGNGLRTMISRIMAPTREAAELMSMMGVNIFDATWQAKNGVERVEALAVAFDKLTQSQKVTVSAAVASRWQINRFDVLMQDIISTTGSYSRALQVTAEDEQVLATRARELNTYLLSQPQAFRMVTTQIQNAMAQAIGPMLPALVALLARVAQLVRWFSELDPAVQQLALSFLLLLAAVGPIARITGAFIQLAHLATGIFKVFGTTVAFLATRAIPLLLAGLGKVIPAIAAGAAPAALLVAKILLIAAAIAAVVAVAWHFRDAITEAVKDAGRWLSQLPSVVVSVFQSVVRIIARAMEVVADWLSYLNPFARHSPSLVDNVRAGIRTILDEYSSLRAVPGIIRNIAAAQNAFAEATAGGREAFRRQQFDEQRQQVVSTAPGAGPAFDAMVSGIFQLERVLQSLLPLVNEQAQVVAVWEARLEEVNEALDEQEEILDDLESTLDAYGKQLDIAKERLNQLASTGIQGAAALEDQIFNNETAQAKLNLEILQIQQSLPALDATRSRLESMRVEANALQAELGHAQSQLSKFTDANISGMGAIDDAIFANQMAQKQLRLEMLKMEQAGQSIEDVRKKLSLLDGELETLRARHQELRLSGAGSDILGPIEDQIAALEEARRQLQSQESPIAEFQKQLEELQVQGEILDLERSLQFDPLLRQIEQMTNMTEEMSFDQIVAGIQKWQPEVSRLTQEYEAQQQAIAADEAALARLEAQFALMTASQERQLAVLQAENEQLQLIQRIEFAPLERQLERLIHPIEEMPFNELYSEIEGQIGIVNQLQSQYDEASATLDAQRVVVDNLRATRDEINDTYQEERDRLDDLESAYSDIEAEIRKMESALNDFAAAASAASSDGLSNAQELFLAGAAGDFEVPGGSGGLGREFGSIEEFNRELEAELEAAMRELGSIDVFAPLKNAWNSTWNWMTESVGGFFVDMASPIGSGLSQLGDIIVGGLGGLFGGGAGVNLPGVSFDAGVLLSPFQAVGDWFVHQFGPTLVNIGDALSEFWSLVQQIGGWLADNLLPILGTIVGAILDMLGKVGGELANWDELWNPLVDALENVWSFIQTFVIAVWDLLVIVANAFKWVLEFVSPVLHDLLVIVGVALAAIAAVWAAVWPTLRRVIETVFGTIGGIIRAALEVVRGIIKFVLSIIGGEWGTAWSALVTIVDGIWDAIYEVISLPVRLIGDLVAGLVEAIVGFFQWLYDVLVGHSIVPDLVNGIIDYFTFLWEHAKEIWEAIGAAIKFVWDEVITPILNAFGSVWTELLKPGMDLLLSEIKKIWEGIGTSLKAVWDTVIVPVWNLFTGVWTSTLKPAMDILLVGFVGTWNGIGEGLKWAWDNLVMPVVNLFQNLWTDILKPAMDNLLLGFRTVWEAVGGAIKWVWDNLIWPAVQDIKGIWDDHLYPAFDGLKRGFDTIWNGVKDIFKGAINFIIDVLNVLIGGINLLSDVIPGIDFSISPIDHFSGGGTTNPNPGTIPTTGQFAAGGRIGNHARIPETDIFVRGGFKTNMPRAIVGEGSPLYPEYVIPTDPRHRANAERLYRAAGADLGLSGIDTHGGGVEATAINTAMDRAPWMGRRMDEIGGWPNPIDALQAGFEAGVNAVSGAIDLASDAAEWAIGQTREAAVRATFAPVLAAADAIIDNIPWDHGQDIANGIKNTIYNWALGMGRGADSQLSKIGFDPSGVPEGGTIDALIEIVDRSGVPYRVASTYRPGAMTATGNVSFHSLKRAVDFATPKPSVDSPGLLAINKALAAKSGILKELIYSGPGAIEIRNGRPHNYTGITRDMHHDHVHAAMAAGGIVTRPISILAGEAGAEAILPLNKLGILMSEAYQSIVPKTDHFLSRDAMTTISNESTTIIFNGDLSFPNIKNGNDAKKFLDNIYSLGDD